MHANISILSQYSGDNLPSESSFSFHVYIIKKKFKFAFSAKIMSFMLTKNFWCYENATIFLKLLSKFYKSFMNLLSPFTFWTDRTYFHFSALEYSKIFLFHFGLRNLVQIGNFVVKFYFAFRLNKNAISFSPSHDIVRFIWITEKHM